MSEARFALWIAGIGAAAVVAISMWLIYFLYKAKLLEREERRLMIEKGMVPPALAAVGWPAVKVREKELEYEERRLRIEKGLPIPATPSELPKEPKDYLRRGLVTMALGLGGAGGAYLVFRTIGISSIEERNWFLFFGVISPVLFLYGLANIIYSRTKDRRGAAVSAPDQVR